MRQEGGVPHQFVPRQCPKVSDFLQSEIAFVSDAEKELLAAREAGVGWPVMCCRPGNNSLTADSCGFAAIRSFLELCRAAED